MRPVIQYRDIVLNLNVTFPFEEHSVSDSVSNLLTMSSEAARKDINRHERWF